MNYLDEFYKKLDYMNEEEQRMIKKASDTALKGFKGVKHVDGSPYIDHTLRTAIILSDMHSDAICIASSLLHWLPEYNEEYSYKRIKEDFGDKIGTIVDSLGKINKLRLKKYDDQSALYLRKILVGLSSDVRVIIIKLAGRLDNLRFIYTDESEEQKQKCIETEDVLIPIAHRLGINYIKSELEDLCLKYLKKDAYDEILEKLNASNGELNKYLNDMKSSLSDLLISHDINFYIKGRVKSVHSIYQKLIKGKKWNQIYDILALRIIVSDVKECYTVIGLIHAKYRPLENRFKDYIAKPKENMYQSLHTGIIGVGGNIFEVQIRTKDMDEIAEYGLASHWSYKEKGSKNIQNLMEQKLELFRSAMEINENDDQKLESDFYENFTSNMIYVYTPKGDVIELPEGSTPVDFAYKVHSHIGDTLSSAIVNDTIVPINYKLKNEDLVKINTNEKGKPKKQWLNFVKTSQAKNKIKAFFSKQDREKYLLNGEHLLEKEIKKRGLTPSKVLNDTNVNKIVKTLKLKDLDELKFTVGSSRYTPSYVLDIVLNEDKPKNDIITKINKPSKNSRYKNDILVSGIKNILVRTSTCCMPVYGDEIVGYITKNSGITVHRKNCSNLSNITDRLISVNWSGENNDTYLTNLYIKTNNTNNNLLDIVTISNRLNINIEQVSTIVKDGYLSYKMLIKVPNVTKLDIFMKELLKLRSVSSVKRGE